MLKQIYIILISISIIGNISAQTIDTQKLDKYFKVLEDNNKFMGSVAIFDNGKIVYTNQVGFADVEANKMPDDNTKYRIGSISKTFTATMVFMAIEKGKLSLDQTIDKYFPDIKNSNKITIANLLNHSSGIHNFTNDKDYLTYNTKPKSRDEMLEIITKKGSDFEPGSKSEYSNSNYVLLSIILEKIYNKSYSDLLNEKIVNPLSLANTYYGGKIDFFKNEANSYIYSGRWMKQPETDMTIPLGAGAIISTPSDLLLFADALFNYKLVNESNINKMKTLKNNFGMGLFKFPFYEKSAYGHNGGIDGFTSSLGYFPEEKCGFALTSNGTNYDNNSISIALLSALFDKPYDIPSFEIIEINPQELDKYLGIYSSNNFPLKITISKVDGKLTAQATGQPSFPLEATAKDKFKFDMAGIVMEFDTEKNQMTFKQGGGTYVLTKEK